MSIIQSLWIGDSFSIMEKLSVSSFLKNGNQFHLYTYDKVRNLPAGVIVKDANKILSSDKIFKYKKHDSYAGFANLFRYKLLLEKGGYWVDTDVVSLKTFDHKEEYVFTKARMPKQLLINKYQICNCIMKAPKGSEILEYCYYESAKKDSKQLSWGETGPELLTKAVKKFKMKPFVMNTNIFCPINWFESEKFINASTNKNIIEKSEAVHLWNEMWRRNGIDKSAKFPETSIYEILKKKYL